MESGEKQFNSPVNKSDAKHATGKFFVVDYQSELINILCNC